MSQTEPQPRQSAAPRYELRFDQLDETYTIVRTEEIGPFPSREAARQFMVDTADERMTRDGAAA